jgi:hypothetical protein
MDRCISQFPLGLTPAVANAFSAAMARTSQPLRILAHLLNRSHAARQTEALESDLHISPSSYKAGAQHQVKSCRIRHGVALLRR